MVSSRPHKHQTTPFSLSSATFILQILRVKSEPSSSLALLCVWGASDWHAGFVPASRNYRRSRSAVQRVSSCCAFVSEQISQYPSVSYHFSATTEHLNAFVCVIGSYVNTAVSVSSPGREPSLGCKGLDSMTVIRQSGWAHVSQLFTRVQQ